MTDKTKAMTSEPTTSTRATGVLPSVVFLAIDVVDRATATAIALLQDARGELRGSVDGAIELAENVTRALFRFARKASQRIDETSGELLTAVDRTLSGAFKASRDTVRAARDLATTASTGVTGDRAAAA